MPEKSNSNLNTFMFEASKKVEMVAVWRHSALLTQYVYVRSGSLNLLLPQLLLNNFQPVLSLAVLTETECAA